MSLYQFDLDKAFVSTTENTAFFFLQLVNEVVLIVSTVSGARGNIFLEWFCELSVSSVSSEGILRGLVGIVDSSGLGRSCPSDIVRLKAGAQSDGLLRSCLSA